MIYIQSEKLKVSSHSFLVYCENKALLKKKIRPFSLGIGNY